jgi:hypothetical protein
LIAGEAGFWIWEGYWVLDWNWSVG